MGASGQLSHCIATVRRKSCNGVGAQQELTVGRYTRYNIHIFTRFSSPDTDCTMIRIFTDTFKNLITTSAVILKTETEHHHLSSLSGDNILGTGVRIGRGEDAVASGSSSSSTPVMDSTQSAMMKQADYVVDVVLPTVLIALLFVGNAIIVYIIFQYRKRKVLNTTQDEEMTLRSPPDVPQV